MSIRPLLCLALLAACASPDPQALVDDCAATLTEGESDAAWGTQVWFDGEALWLTSMEVDISDGEFGPQLDVVAQHRERRACDGTELVARERYGSEGLVAKNYQITVRDEVLLATWWEHPPNDVTSANAYYQVMERSGEPLTEPLELQHDQARFGWSPTAIASADGFLLVWSYFDDDIEGIEVVAVDEGSGEATLVEDVELVEGLARGWEVGGVTLLDEGDTQRVAWLEYEEESLDASIFTRQLGSSETARIDDHNVYNAWSIARFGDTTWIADSPFTEGTRLNALGGPSTTWDAHGATELHLLSMGERMAILNVPWARPATLELVDADLQVQGTLPLGVAVQGAQPIGDDHLVVSTYTFEEEGEPLTERRFGWRTLALDEVE